MKKILFATTALVATAGVASAEIALSGSAEMGIVGGDLVATTQFWTDVDVTFTMTGEADNGLTFGAVVDLDENGAFAGTTQGGETIHIAYGAAKLTMGDTDGAFDAAMQEVGIGGAIADDHTSHLGYNGNAGLDGFYDGQIATFSYSFDSFTGYLSAEIDDAGVDDPVWGLGVKYSGDLGGLTLGVGLGYQTVSFGGADFSILGLSLGTTFGNGLQAIVNYSSAEAGGVNVFDHWAIGLGYSMNALTVGFNYGVYDYGGGFEDSGFGLAVDYDLGGGLEVQFGYGSSDSALGSAFDFDTYSLGLAMSF
jgi:outer membrane protein OmpU